MAQKFYLRRKGHGKFEFFQPTPITSKKQLKKLIDEGIEIFNSRQEAFRHAIALKKEN